MTQIYPIIRTMTFEEQREAGLYNKGLILKQGERIYRLTAGTMDSLYVFEAGALIYVLTINLYLDYVALDCFIGSERDPIDSIFLQGHHAIIDSLGNKWHLLSLNDLANRLRQLYA
jgi:hypothetical protein